MELFDENKAIQYIRGKIGREISELYNDDEFLNVLDMIADWYEQNGMNDIDLDDDEDDDTEQIASELKDYVRRMLKKDRGAKLSPDHVSGIVDAELEYEDMISQL